MIATGQGNFYPRQRGAAIMVMLLILIMGSAYLLLTKLNKGDPQQPRAVDTTAELGAIRDALIGYAQINGGCLPCPSQDPTDGRAPASCTTPPAANRVGFLPWSDLGFGAQDPWGRRYSYIVDPAFAVGCAFPTPGDLGAQTRDNAGVLTPVVIPNGLVAVVLSHGANGFGAADAAGGLLPPPPATHGDERANRRTDLAASRTVTRRAHTTDSAVTGGPFDDLVVWISRDELNARYNDAITP